MGGVTILRSYEVLTDWMPGWSWIGLLCSIFAVLCMALTIYIGLHKPNQWKVLPMLICTAAVLVIATVTSFLNAVPIYETQYNAYLSGAIDMSLFTSKYEIIQQDGLLFTLREINLIS